MRWRCGPSPFVVSSSDAHLSTSGAPAEPGSRINVFPGRLWQTLVWCSRDASRTDLLRVHTSDASPGAARWMASISDQPSLVLLPRHRRCLTNQTHISQSIRDDKWGLKKKGGYKTALCSAVRSRTQISAGNLVCVRVYLDVTFPLTSTFAPHQQLVFVCSPHRCPVWTQADAASRLGCSVEAQAPPWGEPGSPSPWQRGARRESERTGMRQSYLCRLSRGSFPSSCSFSE